MFEALRPALTITWRELRDQSRDWRIVFPILGLTLFFPFLMNFTARQILAFVENYGATIIGERLVPFLLMVVGFFPISVSLVIALESFVGEKERGSIEPLLNTPLEDWQLYVGKLLSSVVPSLLASFLGMTVYLVGLQIKDVLLPEIGLLVQIFTLTVVQAVMMVSAAVVVSTQATSVRAANLLASFIIIPAALLIQGESIVMFWGNTATLWWVVIGVVLLTVLLVRVGLAHFHREELLGREIDVLNIRWAVRFFVNSFLGGAQSLRGWLRGPLSLALRDLGKPFWMALGLTILGFVVGYLQIHRFELSLEGISFTDADERLKAMLSIWQGVPLSPIVMILWQNIRAIFIGMLLGLISLGILGPAPLLATSGIAGYLLALLSANGLPVFTYLLFILPHGIVELPALMIATAAVLRIGALMATPTAEKTVSEVVLSSLADWAKVMVGIVIPFLILAAFIEVLITPRIVLWLLF